MSPPNFNNNNTMSHNYYNSNLNNYYNFYTINVCNSEEKEKLLKKEKMQNSMRNSNENYNSLNMPLPNTQQVNNKISNTPQKKHNIIIPPMSVPMQMHLPLNNNKSLIKNGRFDHDNFLKELHNKKPNTYNSNKKTCNSLLINTNSTTIKKNPMPNHLIFNDDNCKLETNYTVKDPFKINFDDNASDFYTVKTEESDTSTFNLDLGQIFNNEN